ncbi:phytanoyl-CoA dioxygenase family protein [Ichthyenterobacterium sp. W332]|uniref:Phytanoyl-CoA dioxygenase family protein n=1 Tax=Microcosmobacter mediterraneus TaxID=3075607 RepID=A0ABU2YMQ1_9FLAO|nr:phytanoyl-CoA dioxygenase family protein [Ichthyenterobacterium sp. W332]MDT0559443.1 phytanoyl-CoA dioxygenase family protein [Ichthyenterobacterium sp. W332]
MSNILRRYKLPYTLYNFFHKKALVHNLKHYKKYGIDKTYYAPISSEDFADLESEPNTYDIKDSETELPKHADFKTLDGKLQSELLPWSKNGYVILEHFFSEKEVDTVNSEIEDLLAKKRVAFSNGNRIMFANKKSKLINAVGTNPKLFKVLNLLLDKEVELFQSINFFEGSQQRAHSDSIHMTTFPYGNLIAAWIALEDITIDSGPLHYYPGSHKLPYVLNKAYGNDGSKYTIGKKTYSEYEDYIGNLIEKNNLEKNIFLAKKGDVLIWHANLLHGGEPVTNTESSRKSMVFHYYAKDAICFHEITQRPTLKP